MKGKSILIVDDDAEIRGMLTGLFAAEGAVVESAPSFDAAMAILQKHLPDVVITDLMLPPHSGLDIVKGIQKMPLPHPFIVVLTNSINAENVADAVESNVRIFIQKAEHDPHEIVQMVARIFESENR